MYTIYALIILVVLFSLLLHVILGKMGLFGFAERKARDYQDTMSGSNTYHDPWQD